MNSAPTAQLTPSGLCDLCASAAQRPGAGARRIAVAMILSATVLLPMAAVRADVGDDDTAAATEDQAVALSPKLLALARKAFVVCEYWYQKDLSEPAGGTDDYRVQRLYSEFVDQKRPDEIVGIVLDERGHILVPDSALEDRFLKRIVLRDVRGQEFTATRARLLFDAPAVVLQADANAIGKLAGPPWQKLDDKGVDTALYGLDIGRDDERWQFATWPLTPVLPFTAGEPNNVLFATYNRAGRTYQSSRVTLIASPDGNAVGASSWYAVDLRQTEAVWEHDSLMKSDGMDWAQLQKTTDSCRKRMVECMHEVVLQMRAGGGEVDSPSRYGGFGGYGSSAAGRETTVFGVAIGPNRVLVPAQIDAELAKKIDRICVKFSATDRRPARFVGAYKPFEAFVVELTDGNLPAHLELADANLPRMRPFFSAQMRKKFGENYADLRTTRLRSKSRGYAGAFHWSVPRDVQSGNVLLDFEGRLAGLCLNERIEHEEERELQEAGRYSYRGGRDKQRVFLAGVLRKPLTEPNAYLDPKIEIQPPALAKRRAWFGIEYVPMNHDLAEQFKAQKPTRDGRLGYIVNAVYPNSPAEKAGIRIADVLLTLELPGLSYPVELRGNDGGGWGYGGRGWYYRGDDDEGLGPVMPTWQSRTNRLTQALDVVGIGKTIRIHYLRPDANFAGPGKDMVLDYKIEQAPPDQSSAAKWKNRKLGLTVKDLTYEVRFALNLPEGQPGVLLSDVESGSPVEVAKIFPNEILTRIDDAPITSARDLRDRIAAAKASGRDKVRLTILRLGKTRLADLAVAEYDPTADEGIDEGE